MTPLFITYAKCIPEDHILNDLKKAIEQYQLTKDEDSKKLVAMYGMMISTKFLTEGKSISEVLEDVEQKKNILDTFSPDKTI